MKTMNKRTIYLSVCSLAMTLAMYNCKKKDEPFPTEPPTELVNKINDITVTPITITAPAAVTTTASSITASPEAAAMGTALSSLASSGTVPASLTATGTAVTTAIPAADMATLSAVTPATLAAVKAGGAMPADVKAALDKAAANPAIQAYLPKFTFPTVGGKTINGRVGAVGAATATTTTAAAAGVEAVEAVQIDDACIAASEAAFQTAKTKLDAARDAEIVKVQAAYTAAITPLAAAETTCQASVNYTAQRASVDTQIAQALANLEAGKAALTAAGLYDAFVTLVNVQALGAYSGINLLESADKAACTAARTARTASAAAARDLDLSKVQAEYTTKIAAANAVKTELLASCHNQGGGN